MKNSLNKTLGALVCAFTVISAASLAQAAPITDWTETLTGVDFSNPSSSGKLVSADGTNPERYIWDNGVNRNLFWDRTSNPSDGGTAENIQNLPLVHIVQDTRNPGNYPSDTVYSLVTFDFDYTFTLPSDPAVSFDLTFSVPMYAFFDSTANKEYVFYDASSITSTSFIYEGYTYTATDISLGYWGTAGLVEQVQAPGMDYAGWEMTGASYNIFDEFTLSAIANDTAPTPEPATMLLMGAGLAGLGFIARKRKRV